MDLLFTLSPTRSGSLQRQLREQIAAAILDGNIAPGLPLPSSRKLSQQLGIGRNTVMLAYAALEEDGYLIARERSGYFVNPEVLQGRVDSDADPDTGLTEDFTLIDLAAVGLSAAFFESLEEFAFGVYFGDVEDFGLFGFLSGHHFEIPLELAADFKISDF